MVEGGCAKAQVAGDDGDGAGGWSVLPCPGLRNSLVLRGLFWAVNAKTERRGLEEGRKSLK